MMCIYQYPVTPSPASDSTTVIQRKGTIQPIRMEKEPYEAVVSAEGSRFHLLFGSQYSGNFLCIPDWHIGCELSYLNDVFAFCRVQRTPMRFRADAVQSTTDALKQCIFSYSRGFITTV